MGLKLYDEADIQNIADSIREKNYISETEYITLPYAAQFNGGAKILTIGTVGNGVTWTVNSDGSITLSGTNTSAFSFSFKGTTGTTSVFTLPAGDYEFSITGTWQSDCTCFIRNTEAQTTLYSRTSVGTTNFSLSVPTKICIYFTRNMTGSAVNINATVSVKRKVTEKYKVSEMSDAIDIQLGDPSRFYTNYLYGYSNANFTKGNDINLHNLPPDYQEVEWIRSSMNSTTILRTMINSGVKSSENVGFWADFISYNEVSTTSGYGNVFGCRTSSGHSDFQLGTYGSSTATNKGLFRYGDTGIGAFMTPQARQQASYIPEARIYYAPNGTSPNKANVSTTYTYAENLDIILFSMYNSGLNNYSQHGDVQLYRFILFVRDLILRDFIPCYRKSDGVIGLYDISPNSYKINALFLDEYVGTDHITYISNLDGDKAGIKVTPDVAPIGILSLAMSVNSGTYIPNTYYISNNNVFIVENDPGDFDSNPLIEINLTYTN